MSLIVVFLCAIFASNSWQTTLRSWYEPKWESLDKRPAPAWYDEAKIGIYITWGMYSVPSFGSSGWFWRDLNASKAEHVEFMSKNYPPGFTYEDFAPQFTAEFYNPKEWAGILEKSGAKFVVMLARYSDGYAMWPTKYSIDWNAMDVGPHRDLLGEFIDALRETTNLKFGLYYYLVETFNPLFEADKAANFTSRNYVDFKVLPELTQLIEKYKPDLLDINGYDKSTSKYWKAEEFLYWVYNKSPVRDTIVVNDRWGTDTLDKHGDIYSSTHVTHKWFTAIALDNKSAGYRRNAKIEDFKTPEQMIKKIAEVVSGGGNIYIDIGPTKEGTITPIVQERLLDMGTWLKVNGEAIYGTKPWVQQKDINEYTYYTTKDEVVYAINTQWPNDNKLVLKYATELFFKSSTNATLIGGNGNYLEWEIKNGTIILSFPDRETIKTDFAFVVKIQT